MTNYIALSVPVFFLLIGVELLLAWRARRVVYRFSDAITDLSCGVTQQAVYLILVGALLAGYTWVFANFSLWQLDAASPWPWLIAFVGVDFIYYWWHRLSHEVNVLWAAHIVHHHSEDYNLAVALRQGTFTVVSDWPFYLPCAILGVPPIVFGSMKAFSTLYQFWIHSELIGKLGPFEWVFNTASHHRVHHAINPHYLDKNYGAILIIWDRLFGTFALEKEPPVYGVVKALKSYNPLWANLHYALYLLKTSWQAPRWGDKLRIWLKPPAWRPKGLEQFPPAPEVRPESYRKYEPPAVPGLPFYVAVHFVLVAVLLTWLMFTSKQQPAVLVWSSIGLILLSALVWGGLFERKRWAVPVEVVRLLAAAGLCAWFFHAPTWTLAVAGLLTVVDLTWLYRLLRTPSALVEPVPVGV